MGGLARRERERRRFSKSGREELAQFRGTQEADSRGGDVRLAVRLVAVMGDTQEAVFGMEAEESGFRPGGIPAGEDPDQAEKAGAVDAEPHGGA